MPTHFDEAWSERTMVMEWTKCETCGSTEMVPKLTLDRLTEWNSILVHQKPDYVTPQKKKDDAKNKKETAGN